jgi:hypothetical protein
VAAKAFDGAGFDEAELAAVPLGSPQRRRGSRSETSRSPPATPIHVPRRSMTGVARTSTVTPPMSWSPNGVNNDVSDSRHRCSRRNCPSRTLLDAVTDDDWDRARTGLGDDELATE